jgi:four helix bundle suffix protein
MSDHSSGLRPHGGYRKLRSFQVTQIIYDATVSFCDRFVDKRSRTHDQMVQAARSGRQNIAEGSRASATSSQTELRLVGVARASLDELLLDYEDFLRQRRLPQWGKDNPQALAIRALGKAHPTDRSDSAAYAPWLEHADPAVAANALICLIHQANYLLDRQLRGLEQQFVREGGYSERLFSISEHYDRDRAGFYVALQSVRDSGLDLTGWLDYFVEGLATQMDEVTEGGRRVIRRDIIARKHGLNERQVLAVGHLLENPALRIEDFERLCPGVNRRTLQRDLRDLVDEEVLKIKGAARAVAYALRIKGS